MGLWKSDRRSPEELKDAMEDWFRRKDTFRNSTLQCRKLAEITWGLS